MRLGLLGLGRWGKNYVKTIAQMPEIELVRICGRTHQSDSLDGHLRECFTSDWRQVCEDPSLDGIIVATPPKTHHEIVKFCLERGLPAFVEKPFTQRLDETRELLSLSQKFNVLCMVNYIHLYSRGYKELKKNVADGGRIKSIYSESFAHGPFRKDVSVLWDWGCHDIAMCIDLLGLSPESVKKTFCFKNSSEPLGEILTIELGFYDGPTASLTFGNLSEFKRRDFCVLSEKGVFGYDGFSQGLSKNYSQQLAPDDPARFKLQPSPLECGIREFVIHIARNENTHHTLALAERVNSILEKIGTACRHK